MQKAIGYIRVSTQGQADEGVSLSAQRAKIEAWCIANDMELAAVFTDAGLSGGSMAGRDGLHATLRVVAVGHLLAVGVDYVLHLAEVVRAVFRNRGYVPEDGA